MVHDGTHLVIPAIESTSCRLRLLTAFYIFTLPLSMDWLRGKSTGHLYHRARPSRRQAACYSAPHSDSAGVLLGELGDKELK